MGYGFATTRGNPTNSFSEAAGSMPPFLQCLYSSMAVRHAKWQKRLLSKETATAGKNPPTMSKLHNLIVCNSTLSM